MFAKKNLLLFFLPFSMSVPFYATSCSCSDDKGNCNIDRSFDGSDWYGLDGNFTESDYKIENDKIVYLHIDHINKAKDLVIPNYVFLNGRKLSVYLGESLFSGFFEIYDSVYLNSFIVDIPNHIFEHCINLEKIFLMNKMINVGERSFYNCMSLKTIEFSKYSKYYGLSSNEIFKSVESISNEAFYNVELNIDIIFEQLKSIGFSAFNGCTQIKSVIFLDNCLSEQKSLEDECFSNCWSINFVLLNKNIVSIGKRCFLGCYNIIKINWEINCDDKQIIINDQAFQHCKALQQICSKGNFSPYYIGDHAFDSDLELLIHDLNDNYNFFFYNTKYIGEYAFANCTKVESIKIFYDYDFIIKSYAFYGCKTLHKIDFSDFQTYKPWWTDISSIFDSINKYGEFYISIHSNKDVWQAFFKSQTSEDIAVNWKINWLPK